jgi:hypothetical protein
MLRLRSFLLCFLAFIYPLAGLRAADDLYGAKGISAAAVR